MKLIQVLPLVWAFFQWNFIFSEGLDCYKCVYYEGPVFTDKHDKPPDTSCQLNGNPPENFLRSCKSSPGKAHENFTCGLIHVEGRYKGAKYEMTIRDCLSVHEKQLECRDDTSDFELTLLLDSIDSPERDLVKMKPSDASFIGICACDENGCNKDAITAKAKAGQSCSLSMALTFDQVWLRITFLAVLSQYTYQSTHYNFFLV